MNCPIMEVGPFQRSQPHPTQVPSPAGTDGASLGVGPAAKGGRGGVFPGGDLDTEPSPFIFSPSPGLRLALPEAAAGAFGPRGAAPLGAGTARCRGRGLAARRVGDATGGRRGSLRAGHSVIQDLPAPRGAWKPDVPAPRPGSAGKRPAPAPWGARDCGMRPVQPGGSRSRAAAASPLRFSAQKPAAGEKDVSPSGTAGRGARGTRGNSGGGPAPTPGWPAPAPTRADPASGRRRSCRPPYPRTPRCQGPPVSAVQVAAVPSKWGSGCVQGGGGPSARAGAWGPTWTPPIWSPPTWSPPPT